MNWEIQQYKNDSWQWVASYHTFKDAWLDVELGSPPDRRQEVRIVFVCKPVSQSVKQQIATTPERVAAGDGGNQNAMQERFGRSSRPATIA